MGRPPILKSARKINLRIDEELYEGLRLHSFWRKSNPSEMIREAVREFLRRHPPKKPT